MDKVEIALAYSMIEKVIFSEILVNLSAKGAKAPFVVVGASRNRTAYVFHVPRIDAPPEKLVVSSIDHFVTFPVDCVVIDGAGAVHRVSIEGAPRPAS